MNIRTSTLDGETLVIEIEDGDTGSVVDLMDARENGFALFGEDIEVPMAVVDGRLFKKSWFTADHLLAIEAHELGHIRTESIEEPVAEREGIRLLESAGCAVAANILKERGVA
jgi:Zn-dependent protease with chaperone function